MYRGVNSIEFRRWFKSDKDYSEYLVAFFYQSLKHTGIFLSIIKMFEIRRLKSFENSAVKVLIEEGLREHLVNYNETLNPDLEHLYSDYDKDGNVFLVLLIDEIIVAAGGLKKNNADTAEIKRLSVKKEFRNQHIGSHVLKSLEEYAVSFNYRKIILETTTTWLGAKIFYTHNEYIEIYTQDGNTYFEKKLVRIPG